MNKAARGLLYFFGAFFMVYGATALFAPDIIAGKLYLSPVTIAGTSEIRGLYGGGFAGFGVVILTGLRSKALGSGLLMSMATIMGGVVVGRVVSLAIDHETAFTIPAAVAEILVAGACWVAAKGNEKAA